MASFLPVVRVVVFSIAVSRVTEGSLRIRKVPGDDFDEKFADYLDHIINSTKIQSAVVFMDCAVGCQDAAKSCIEKLDLPISINSVGTVTDNILVILFQPDLPSFSGFFERLTGVKHPSFLIVRMCPECSLGDTGLRQHFEVFWKHNFTSVRAVVDQANGDLKIYGFRPYSQSHCGEVGPVLELEVYSSSGRRVTKSLTRDQSNVDLHGCPLRIHARNRPPDTEIVEVAPEKYSYSGCGGLLLKTAMEALNFTAAFWNLKKPVRKGSVYSLALSNNEEICCGGLLNQTVDIVVVTLTTLIFYKEGKIELAKPIAQDCFQFYTPCGLSEGGFMAWSASYSKAFSASVWIMIFLCVALLVVLMSAVGRQVPEEYRFFSSPLADAFYLVGAFFNISLPVKPRSTPLRVLCAHVFFSFLIVSVVFEAYVKSFRSTTSADRMNIKDLDEILRMNLKVSFAPQAYTIWNNTSDELRGGGLKNIYVAKSGGFEDLVDGMVLGRDSAMFGPQRLVEYYSFNREEHKSEQQDNRMSTCAVRPCLFKPHISQFIFKKGSFLVEPINGLIQRLEETGIVQHWWAMNDPYTKRRVFTAGVVTFKEILSSLYILGFGLSLSVFVFFVEAGVFNYKKIRGKFQRKTYSNHVKWAK